MSVQPSRIARGLDLLLRGYQHLTAGRPPRCRYYPTCSQYARDAVESHGAFGGSWLAMRRLGRCHPFGGHGFDPVPEPRHHRHNALRGADPC